MKEKLSKGALIFALCVACLVSGLFGGALSRHLVNSPLQITYADLIAVMLTGVTTLLAIVAVGIAVMAFIGWNAIEGTVNKKAEEFVDHGFREEQNLNKILRSTAEEVILRYIKYEMEENDLIFRELQNVIERARYQDIPAINEKPEPIQKQRRSPKNKTKVEEAKP